MNPHPHPHPLHRLIEALANLDTYPIDYRDKNYLLLKQYFLEEVIRWASGEREAVDRMLSRYESDMRSVG